jgi:hypothetical protein
VVSITINYHPGVKLGHRGGGNMAFGDIFGTIATAHLALAPEEGRKFTTMKPVRSLGDRAGSNP